MSVVVVGFPLLYPGNLIEGERMPDSSTTAATLFLSYIADCSAYLYILRRLQAIIHLLVSPHMRIT